MPAIAPKKLTIRTYDVGFGDCFLLTFHYPQKNRHILIDFGSMRQPEGKVGTGKYMERIAAQISADCSGKLDAVVATHRHQDHISGFARTDESGPGEIIRNLKPRVVVQPWTEDPKAARDARKATTRANALHLQMLDTMQTVAAHLAAVAPRLGGGSELSVARERLAAIGMDNISNRAAIENLQTMGRVNRYVSFGSRSGLESLLPGVRISVLGPPTLKQTETILKQRRRDPEEFWHLNRSFWKRAAMIAEQNVASAGVLFPKHPTGRVPRSARWFKYYATRELVESLLSIVRILDDAMNNTSVILLFEVGGKRILFPGDAQYENWMYALNQPEILAKLAGVSVYKVGHHGSLNATPRTLWNNLDAVKGGDPSQLTTFLSTKTDVHGHADRKTEVPRETLVQQLESHSTLVNTLDFAPTELVRATEIAL